MAYTSWSQFQELKAKGSNGQTLFYKDEAFKDAYRIAIGTTYVYDDNWTFRTGIAFDDSPVPAGTRSISCLLYTSNIDGRKSKTAQIA